jgi:hypothetical protein
MAGRKSQELQISELENGSTALPTGLRFSIWTLNTPLAKPEVLG